MKGPLYMLVVAAVCGSSPCWAIDGSSLALNSGGTSGASAVLNNNGYVGTSIDGGHFLKNPASQKTQLLDLVFHKMTGMNFIAYLVQTLDEVISGRKDLDLGILQFSQTLQKQGVPLPKHLTQLGSWEPSAQGDNLNSNITGSD